LYVNWYCEKTDLHIKFTEAAIMSFEAATSSVNGTRYLDFTVIRILYYTGVFGTVNFKTIFFFYISQLRKLH